MNQKMPVACAARAGSAEARRTALQALSHFERLAVRMVRLPGGEQRDGDLIRRRADGLAPQLH